MKLFTVIKDGGLLAFVCIALYYQSDRINRLELALFDCVGVNYTVKADSSYNHLTAIKPKKFKTKISYES